jgi:drug/metabolite transporter (DMT)-like permease
MGDKPAIRASKPDQWIGYALGALGAMFFATKGIVIKLALMENVDAVTTLTWRMIIAVPFFAAIGWLGYRDRKAKSAAFSVRPGAVIKTALVGLIGYYLASYLDFVGLEFITAQFDRLILMTYPIFVVLIGAIFLGRRMTRTMVVSLALSYGGLAVIFARDLSLDGENVLIGALLVLGAAISYAIYQLLAKPLIDELGARLFTSIAMSAAGFSIIGQFVVTRSPADLAVSGKAMWLMAAMGTVSTVLPAYLISASIGRVGPEPTAVMGNVAPLVTIVLAVSVLGEAFSIWHALGAAMVLIGVIRFTQADRRAARLLKGRSDPNLGS